MAAGQQGKSTTPSTPGTASRARRSSAGKNSTPQPFESVSTPKSAGRYSKPTAPRDESACAIEDWGTPVGGGGGFRSPRGPYSSSAAGGGGAIGVGSGVLGGVSSVDVSKILDKRDDDDDDDQSLVTMYGGGGRHDHLRFGSGTGIGPIRSSAGCGKGWKGSAAGGGGGGGGSSSGGGGLGAGGGRGGWFNDEPGMISVTAAGSGHSASGVGCSGDAGGGGRTALDAIVTSFLRNQHERCPDPVCVLPPLSLFEPHRCPARTPAGAVGAGAPPSVTKRALALQVCMRVLCVIPITIHFTAL